MERAAEDRKKERENKEKKKESPQRQIAVTTSLEIGIKARQMHIFKNQDIGNNLTPGYFRF